VCNFVVWLHVVVLLHFRMTNREPLPGLNIGDDPGRILSWTSIGYDPVARECPAAHYFPDCISALDRIKAHEAPCSWRIDLPCLLSYCCHRSVCSGLRAARDVSWTSCGERGRQCCSEYGNPVEGHHANLGCRTFDLGAVARVRVRQGTPHQYARAGGLHA
jgi:hypothetical protein